MSEHAQDLPTTYPGHSPNLAESLPEHDQHIAEYDGNISCLKHIEPMPKSCRQYFEFVQQLDQYIIGHFEDTRRTLKVTNGHQKDNTGS